LQRKFVEDDDDTREEEDDHVAKDQPKKNLKRTNLDDKQTSELVVGTFGLGGRGD
jgi:hypothetical protein